MLKIRLRRMGTKHRPFYRIVVSDSRRTPRARFTDVLGTYDPTRNPAAIRLDLPRAEEWMRKGAHPSATVASLLNKVRATPSGSVPVDS
ncbi:MAG: 30S ribosomal protein S16 [Acidobacteriota bacterium]